MITQVITEIQIKLQNTKPNTTNRSDSELKRAATSDYELKRTAYELDSQCSERQSQRFLLLRAVCEQQRNNTRNHANDNKLKRGKSCRKRSYRQ